ncbi:MAG TPA: hypothetical protein VGZ47_20200 [Gemmataceae bacterium]|jgi:hypothetical protein|nr:hypothetical protein [Gemmataceae bacterium]
MPRRSKRQEALPHRAPEHVRTVYIETSVWGMTVPGQPPALRQPTLEFLRQCGLGFFAPYISTVVTKEVAQAPEWEVAQMEQRISGLAPTILEPSAESDQLAEVYLKAGIIPAKKEDDARHVAIATVARIDLVVSWNHKHLSGERKGPLFNAANRLAGYEHPLLILTPFGALQ